MRRVFIIGLPTTVLKRLVSQVGKNDIRITGVLAGLGKEGEMQLLPFPAQAAYELRMFVDDFESWNDAEVIVLGYAPIPDDLDAELEVISEIGAKVSRTVPGEDGWAILTDNRPDAKFFDELFDRLAKDLLPVRRLSPSEYFLAKAAENVRMIITTGSLKVCDKVPPHRRKFFIDTADAFMSFLERNGKVGRIDEFFDALGLGHAQSGGIITTLNILKGGKTVYKDSLKTHVKQGDATAKAAAVRVYYHAPFLEKVSYIAILYGGPHPDLPIARTHNMDDI